MKFYGPHLMDGVLPTCKLCGNRIPPVLSASGCEKNVIDLDAAIMEILTRPIPVKSNGKEKTP